MYKQLHEKYKLSGQALRENTLFLRFVNKSEADNGPNVIKGMPNWTEKIYFAIC